MAALHPSWQRSPNIADERRRAPRREAQLEARLLFSVSVYAPQPTHKIGASLPLKLAGYTQNISETGLALVVPSMQVGSQYFNVVGCRLRLILDLPDGAVEIHATPVRCGPVAEDKIEKGYLVGVRITQMHDHEWVRLVQYVRSLR